MAASAAVAFVVVVAGAGSGCSGGDDPPPLPTEAPSDAALLAARPYSPTVPAGYTASQSWPLLIVLAGYGDHAVDTSAWLGFTKLAADEGILLVTPDPDPAQLRLAWDPGPDHAPNFDVEYLRAIIRDMERRYSVDRARVFVAGHSLGAHMAHRMGCDDADDVVAIFALAGQVAMMPADCAPTRPVSVVQVHGTDDMVIGYYGDVQDNPPDPGIPSAHQTVAVWARNDRCADAIADTGARLDLDSSLAGNETTVEAYGGCARPDGTGGLPDGGAFPDGGITGPGVLDGGAFASNIDGGIADGGVAGTVGVELWSIVGGSHDPVVTDPFAPLVWRFLVEHRR